MKKKGTGLTLLADLLCLIAGAAIYAVAVDALVAPHNIAPGGVTGIATMLNYLFDTPIGAMVFVINIPIVIWAILEIGYKLVLKTLLAIVLSAVFIDWFALFVPVYDGDPLLNALLAGVIEGVGLSLTFIRGATTGGTDMIARLLTRRFRHLSMGKLMLLVDGIVVLLSTFVFKSVDSAVYACIVIFVSTAIIDAILYGVDAGTGKMFFVISPKTKEMSVRIMSELDRGVTFLDARGGYTNEHTDILFCAVRRFEVFKINTIIREEDRNAFVIVGDAGEISGEGFRPVQSDDKPLKDILSNIKNRNALPHEAPPKD